MNDKLSGLIGGCVASGAKAFGFSILWKDHLAGKTYFEADGPLAKEERGCITEGVKGMTADDAPVAGDALYFVRVTAAGIAIKARPPKP